MRLIILIVILGFSTSLMAQEYDWTAGLRLGKPAGVTVKKMLDYRSAVEGIVGTDFNSTISVTGLYEFHGYIKYNVIWYAGGGITALVATNEDGTNDFSGDLIGGIEYNFLNLPITASLDWKPGFSIVEKKPFFDHFALSIRYVLTR